MGTKIPLSDIDIHEEEIQVVADVIGARWLSVGKQTQQFEQDFAKRHGAPYATAVSSGTAALHIACQALDLGPNDEVICPSLTFVATANAVLYTGAKPVFAEITSADDLTLSPDDIEEKITERTKAISVVHYAGYACDMKQIMKIAAKYNLYVIEDTAHAPDVTYGQQKLGAIGTVGCFSFFSNKNMTTGEGGMLLTHDEKLAQRIARIRSHGMNRLTLDQQKGHAFAYDVTELGFNYRIDEMRSAIGRVQLGRLAENNKKRKECVQRYRELLAAAPRVTVPFASYQRESAYHIFPVLLAKDVDRGKFMSALTAAGIQTTVHYPPVHLFSLYRERFGYQGGEFPLTESICRREVTLPLYPTMGMDSVEYIVTEIKKFFK